MKIPLYQNENTDMQIQIYIEMWSYKDTIL